jgi:predicted nucleic acid-binding protein
MIILDTNVISELMQVKPAASVTRWTAGLPWNSLCTTTITQAEILLGLWLLPKGRRRDALEEAAWMMFDQVFSGRVFSFDGTQPVPTRASWLRGVALAGRSRSSTPRSRRLRARQAATSRPATRATSRAAGWSCTIRGRTDQLGTSPSCYPAVHERARLDPAAARDARRARPPG